MRKENKRMVIFGIDGGTFNIMQPLLHKGDLPHLASLMSQGTSAPLLSTIPFVTPTAFTSFMTGVNPGKHGIFDFTAHSHATYDTGPLVGYPDIRVKTLWELLSEHNKRSNIITVPFTYPPSPLNGTALCLGNISMGRMSSYPPELAQEITGHIGGYEERYCKVIKEPDGAPPEELLDEYVKLCYYQVEKCTQAARYLLETYPWDVFMMVFVITDRFQHYFWRHMDPAHPAYDPVSNSKRGELIADSYRKIDEAIGDIMKLVPEHETNVIVMSDHGFGPLNYMFYTNRWLEKNGLLHFHKKRMNWAIGTPTIERCMEKLGLSSVANLFPSSVKKVRIPIAKKTPKPLVESIDWSRTKAYGTRWGININLKYREPFGVVEPGHDYDTLVETIIKDIDELKDPKTNKPLFKQVVRKEEIYHGPYIDEAHDILFNSNKLVFRKDDGHHDFLREIEATDLGNGEHIREGILILKGPLIHAEGKLDSPQLEDLAPTILYLLDLPIPDYMDGKVLTTCIQYDALRQKPPVILSSVSSKRGIDDRLDSSPQTKEGAKAEDERIRQQLKDLGYIE